MRNCSLCRRRDIVNRAGCKSNIAAPEAKGEGRAFRGTVQGTVRPNSLRALAPAGNRARLSAVPIGPNKHWALAPAGTLVPRDFSDQSIQNREVSDFPCERYKTTRFLLAHSLSPVRGTKVPQGLKPRFLPTSRGTARSRALLPAAAKAKPSPSAEARAEPRQFSHAQRIGGTHASL